MPFRYIFNWLMIRLQANRTIENPLTEIERVISISDKISSIKSKRYGDLKRRHFYAILACNFIRFEVRFLSLNEYSSALCFFMCSMYLHFLFMSDQTILTEKSQVNGKTYSNFDESINQILSLS